MFGVAAVLLWEQFGGLSTGSEGFADVGVVAELVRLGGGGPPMVADPIETRRAGSLDKSLRGDSVAEFTMPLLRIDAAALPSLDRCRSVLDDACFVAVGMLLSLGPAVVCDVLVLAKAFEYRVLSESACFS